ncbi:MULTISPECIES: STAS domain-containing protein [unclassified Corallococcus]|uniref:STAS domain-containing protein n=1 Tax=unclassified Corallococcus TaxID=2685029 RepID=UPI001A901F45|nr:MULTISPECIES: STAS domain-containing protein [unclassified Corallococcus]MBN9685641.1 hypothetical protein [Corallococcus sp. NCSPR001]WAS82913.1 hypothetical protein O0N60_26740 [Corallococcus sp. NCRR]
MEHSSAAVRTLTPTESELADVGAPLLLGDAQRAFATGVTTLLIDLRRVSRLDARAADTLVRLARRAPGHVRLVLLSPAPSARFILQALRLEEIFDLHEDAAEVLRAAG